MMRLLIAFFISCSVAMAGQGMGPGPGVKGYASGGPTITYVATGTVAGGATPTAPTPGIPAGIQAGDLLVLSVENKYPTNSPATPTGWTLGSNCQGTGGAGTAAADAGSTYSTVFYKKAIGNETGTQTVSIPSANSSRAAIVAYRPTAGYEIIPVCTNGSYDHSATTAWSVTGAADPGFAAGDWALVVSANNSDLAASFSAQAMTATGYTFGTMTERVDSVETQGNDSSLVVADFAAGTGTSSAAPVYTMTGATNGTSTPAGASTIVRMRPTADVTAPTLSASLPSGTVNCPADPTEVTIGLTTDEAANCKWDTSDVAYASMANAYTVGQGVGVHTTSVGNLACEATGTYYTRCVDTTGNSNASSNTHSVTMAALATGGPDVWYYGSGLGVDSFTNNTNYGNDTTGGDDVTCTAAGTITKLAVRANAASGNSAIVAITNGTTDAVLGYVNVASVAAGWNEGTLGTPISCTTGQAFKVYAVFSGNTYINYASTSGGLYAAGVTYANITSQSTITSVSDYQHAVAIYVD